MNKTLRKILIFFILVAFISTISYCSAPYDTETAKIITVKKTVTGSGFILRNETPVTPNTNGIFEPGIKEGTRVSKGSSIGVTISGNLSEKLSEELEEVTKRIEEIEQSGSISDLYSSDEARMYTALSDLTGKIRDDVYSENYSSASMTVTQLVTLLSKKYAPENGLAADNLLLELKERKYEIEQQLGGVREDIKAPVSGLFYRTLDGLEDSGTEKDIASLSAAKINGFSKDLENFKPQKKNVGKIVNTYVWYIAATVDITEAEKLPIGKTVTLTVDDSVGVDAVVLAVNHVDGDKEAAVIIKSTRSIAGIFEKRTAEFELCYEEYTGLYVPSAAIRVVDSVTGVYVLNRSKTVSFKCVDILLKEDNYYIVNKNYIPPEGSEYQALRLYDDIFVNPEVVD